MVLELMGVRLMAPHFGQSQIVWTNVIGVVLAALAAGQWWGGRLAEAGRATSASLALLAAGAVAAVLPELVRWLAGWTLPDALRLDEAAPFVTRGSLLVALVALGVPLLALGVVTPCLVRLSRGVERRPGAVTGRLLGAGTLGSLVGTFGATHVLLPAIGSAAAVRVGAALLLGAAGLLWVCGARPSRRGAGLCAIPLAALALPTSTPSVAAEWSVLEARETEYQYARVLEDDAGRRWLALNEGLDSFHSVLRPGELLTGDYYDAFLLPSLMAGGSTGEEIEAGSEPTRDVLVVGLAAGTMARQLLALDPSARVTGVELDPELLELGERWFELPDRVETLSGVDGRFVLERADRKWGAILVDAFSSQIYVPPQLATVEAFRALREHLEPGGWAALNLSARGIEDPVARAVVGTFGEVFPGAAFLRVPGTRNLFVLGRRGVPSALPPAGAAELLRSAGLLPQLAWLLDEGAWAPAPKLPESDVLVDGAAPLEHLAHRAWIGDWALEAEGGAPRVSELPPDALARLEFARASLRRTQWSEAAALLEAPPPVGTDVAWRASRDLLRGNLAYERGDWAAAEAAYEAVLRAPGDDAGLRAAAGENLSFVRGALMRDVELARAARGLTLAIVVALTVFGVLFAALLLRSPGAAARSAGPA